MVDKFEDHCWQDLVTEEIMDIYKPYRRETYVGNRPALLAIDLYNLVYKGGPRPVSDVVKERAQERVRRVCLQRHRAHQRAV